MDKMIKVIGESTISTSPDYVIISLSISKIDSNYSILFDYAKEKEKYVVDQISKIDELDSNNIKSIYFNITPYFENNSDENGVYRREFKGYKYSEDIQVSFKKDDTILSKVIEVISKFDFNPEFHIDYKVLNQKNIQEKLLKLAILDAKKKANILARASDVSLGNVIQIDQSLNEATSYPQPMMLKCNDTFSSIDPKDISYSLSVSVIFEIK